jgi:hypothetical protein
MYNGQIQEIWELDFHGFQIPLFCYNWVDANKGIVKDKYGFITVDLNRQGYKLEPFMLAKRVAQIFYVSDTTNKILKVVIPKNDESSGSRMSSIRKSLISLMRFVLSSPRCSSQEYHHPKIFCTCETTTMKKSRISKNQERNGK